MLNVSTLLLDDALYKWSIFDEVKAYEKNVPIYRHNEQYSLLLER